MTGCFNCPIYSQLSDYDYTEWQVKNKAANTPITFEEIAVVMIITGIVLNPYRGCKYDVIYNIK